MPKQPENNIYIAFDTFCWITLFLATFLSTVMDTKLLLMSMRTQVAVQRSYRETNARASSNGQRHRSYDESLSQALNEVFHSYITMVIDND
ncbi:hypothetical protein O3G_MSEX001493 [Manduca sexta]|uniref:Uncharacterized protein n=1 Tax=Manduca sexta TaxID=7130 RepID=A0A921YL58_MANSE|nr:hypothetical protein O3G_MSEX001493 [Manduca sexta]